MAYVNKEKQLKNRREHYLNNKQTYLDKAKKNREISKARNFNFIYEYLLQHSCVDCGESDPIVLEFDHVADNKESNVSSLIAGSLEKLITEISKCEVRCANCHKKITAKRGNFRKYRMSHSFNGQDTSPRN